MTIPKSLEAKFEAAGRAKREAAERQPKDSLSARRDWMGRRASRRQAQEAQEAARAIFAWLDTEDAHAVHALGERHGVRVMLSGGIPPVARHAIALGEEPGTIWVLRISIQGGGTVTVRSAAELVLAARADALLSLAKAIESREVFEQIAQQVERVAAGRNPSDG